MNSLSLAALSILLSNNTTRFVPAILWNVFLVLVRDHRGGLRHCCVHLGPQLAAHDLADDRHRVRALVDDAVDALDDRRLDAQLLRKVVRRPAG